MPRIILVLSLLLLAPTAFASSTIASVGIGPHGVVQDGGRPYYLLAHVSAPEAPREAASKEDCSEHPEEPGAHPPDLATALRRLVAEVAAWDPVAEPRISGWYPRCIAFSLQPSGAVMAADGHVAYHMPSGRYYARLESATLPVPLPVGLPVGLTLVFGQEHSGTTGLGTEADCEGCPPPTG